MLVLERVNVRIDATHVLRNVSLEVEPGATVALVGRNGAGKTTTLRTVMGLVARSGGTITFAGTDIDAVPPHRRPALGIGYAPEDRRLFSAFSVEDNILLPARVARTGKADAARKLEGWFEDRWTDRFCIDITAELIQIIEPGLFMNLRVKGKGGGLRGLSQPARAGPRAGWGGSGGKRQAFRVRKE